jgi:serine/threonine protein kinase
MTAESAVLECLRSVLVKEVEPSDPGDLVIVHAGPARRRSSLYFLGLAGSSPTCRWVVKQPNGGSHQEDLQSPLSAAGQFQALQRLHGHLRQCDGSVATPRPVAYVPEIDAYVMEYVPGPTLTALLRPRAVLRPHSLLNAVAGSGQALHAVHSLEAAEADCVDLPGLNRRAATRGRQLLETAGLPTQDRWFVPSSSAYSPTAWKVLLHGDFAPENVLLSPSGLFCLEPDLCVRDWAEHDVARFLLMLFDAPLFVAGVDIPAVQNLRRRAAATFLDTYYGEDPWPDALRPLMVLSLTARWSTRHTDLAQRAPRLRRARELLLRRHFASLLDEVSSPAWPAERR